MRYYCEWQEEAIARRHCSGYVEAASEDEACQRVRDGGVEVDVCTAWDILDSTDICINSIGEA